MEQANIVMKINKMDTIPKSAVTPAEVVILSHKDHGHFNNVGGFPLTVLDIKGEALALAWNVEEGIYTEVKGKKRSDAEEIARLSRTYGKKKVEACFPGASPKLPQTFAEVAEIAGPTCAAKVEDLKEVKK
jgi:hypothetical protein